MLAQVLGAIVCAAAVFGLLIDTNLTMNVSYLIPNVCERPTHQLESLTYSWHEVACMNNHNIRLDWTKLNVTLNLSSASKTLAGFYCYSLLNVTLLALSVFMDCAYRRKNRRGTLHFPWHFGGKILAKNLCKNCQGVGEVWGWVKGRGVEVLSVHRSITAKFQPPPKSHLA